MKKKSSSKPKLEQKTNTKKTFKKDLEKFRKLVGAKAKNIDWPRIGTLSLAVLIVLAIKGVFGPKARIVAIALAKTIIV